MLSWVEGIERLLDTINNNKKLLMSNVYLHNWVKYLNG